MAAAPATATLLLPARARLAGAPLPERVARALGRADRLADGDPGERAQLLRHFELLPRSWPVAALTRQRDAGDAAGASWLRADPAFVRPDINGARLLGIGESLRLAREDAEALLPALRPLFGDAGFPIDAPTPARWYLRLPREARLPLSADAGEVLGADLFDHLPDGPEGRRWRALLSEAQVVLHNHPHNALRGERGLPPVNSLWFWGGGVLPDQVRSPHAQVRSDDLLLRSLALAAGIDDARAVNEAGTAGSVLVDYRALAMFDDGLAAWVDAAAGGRLARLVLDFADGARWAIARPQRWRIWRRPLRQLPA